MIDERGTTIERQIRNSQSKQCYRIGVVSSSSCTLKCLLKQKKISTTADNQKTPATHVSTLPPARHDPSPFSPQVTIHRPRTRPAPSSVSATVSSAPGRTPRASSGGS